MDQRFGKLRVKKGLLHFFVGKSVSAAGGFFAMLLVVQALSISDFAMYSVLVALVEVFNAVSGFGLTHVVLRYVPELYVSYRTHSLRRVILSAFGIRLFLLVAGLGMMWLFSRPVSSWIGVGESLAAFEAFLLIVLFRSTNQFLSQILESALHQGVSQAAYSVIALGRCFGMLWLVNQGNSVALIDVIRLETICEAAAMAVMLSGIGVMLWGKGSKDRGEGDAGWFEANRPQMTRFAASAWFQHLATLPFGGNTNRLVGGAMFGNVVMASFGFALSLYEYAKRYLPTQLLIGMIRPIVVARYATTRRFSDAASLCEQSFQFNLVLLGALIAMLLVSGDSILGFVSGGKYIEHSVNLLCILLLLLAFETHRLILEVLAQMVEHYEILIPSNLFLSSSVLGGIAGYYAIGAIAFPLANLAALVIANGWTIHRLAKLGFSYVHDWTRTLWSLSVLTAATGAGKLVVHAGGNWLVALAATVLVLGLLFLKVQLDPTIRFARELIGAKA